MSQERFLASRKSVPFFAALVALGFFLSGHGIAAEGVADLQEPVQVIQAYLRATYARDFVQAYGLISSEDKKVRDMNRYVRQRGAFNGFTLEAARKLSEAVDIEPQGLKGAGERVQLLVKYRVPDTKKIAPTLLNWDPLRLNALNAAERDRILATLTKKRQDRSLEMIEGEESFELIKENNEWRVYLNWAAGVKIPVQLDVSLARDLQVELSRQEVVLQPGEIFEIQLKIKNKRQQPITTRIGHLVDPQENADYLDFVQCGFLLPVTIPGKKEEVYSGTYMLRGSLPEGVRQLSLTYDFKILE
jgi:hypothetical protein